MPAASANSSKVSLMSPSGSGSGSTSHRRTLATRLSAVNPMRRHNRDCDEGAPDARLTLQHGDQALPAVEGLVEGRKIGDLQGDDDHPCRPGGNVHRSVGPPAEIDCPDGEARA